MHGLSDIIAMNEAKAREMIGAANREAMSVADALNGPHGRPMPAAHAPANNNRDAEPFSRDFNTFVVAMARECWPDGYRVVNGYKPGSLDGLRRDTAAAGTLTVDADHSDGKIFGDPTVTHAFRAWHDWCHLADDWEFTPDGERGAANMQMRHVRKRVHFPALADFFCDLIDCEINGHAQHVAIYGDWPQDQRKFARVWLTEGPDAALGRIPSSGGWTPDTPTQPAPERQPHGDPHAGLMDRL